MLVGETKQILGENPDALFMVEGYVNADYEAFNNNFRAVTVISLFFIPRANMGSSNNSRLMPTSLRTSKF